MPRRSNISGGTTPPPATGSSSARRMRIRPRHPMPGDPARRMSTGAAYVFRHAHGAWTHEATLTAPTPKRWMYFGSSVAISGDRIVIGANSETTVCKFDGAAYVFEFDVQAGAWVHRAKLTASDPI